ncbi:CRISPR-associated protein Csx15 [Chloroflexus sp.]|uniref:CRISPR-associated protein Csx15 n=1 Tax=Chloroflexus sp. TaxID=1904827 RepID=UPI00262CDC01|nr:CRISPR-associated protein Csx15 [uncultured Chloroflexus sp.]
MLLLNYSHPLTTTQLEQAEALLGERPDVRQIAVHIDRGQPLAEVACQIADAAGLSPDEWQTTALVVNPPGLSPLALALIAEIHGRRGDFPPILNIRPVPDSVPTRYEVAEIVNLTAIRLAARGRR